VSLVIQCGYSTHSHVSLVIQLRVSCYTAAAPIHTCALVNTVRLGPYGYSGPLINQSNLSKHPYTQHTQAPIHTCALVNTVRLGPHSHSGPLMNQSNPSKHPYTQHTQAPIHTCALVNTVRLGPHSHSGPLMNQSNPSKSQQAPLTDVSAHASCARSEMIYEHTCGCVCC